jgi:hypothetical protein
MRDRFPAIQFVESILDRRKKLDAVGDVIERAIIREFADSFKNALLLRHSEICPAGRTQASTPRSH